MNYYKKHGAKTNEEMGMLQSIEAVIEEKGIPRHEIPECNTFDDLIEVKHLVDAYEGQDQGKMANENYDVEEVSIVEPTLNENEQIEQKVGGEDDQEFESLEEDVLESQDEPIEDFDQNSEQGTVEPEIELAEVVDGEDLDFVVSDYDPFAEPIIERSYNQSLEIEDAHDHEDSEIDPLGENLEEAKEPTPIDSPSERTKLKAAQQTADTLLKGYSRLAPKPFKWLAKVSESKVEKLAMNGQIDLNMEVQKGMTFDQYVEQTNEQVEEMFEIDEDTLEEIREPLVEVLMEQELELTPQQRLGMAILSHLMQMFTVAMKLRSQNNRILTYQKKLTRMAQAKSA